MRSVIVLSGLLFSFISAAKAQSLEFYGRVLENAEIMCLCQQLRSPFHKHTEEDKTIVEELCKAYDYVADPVKRQEFHQSLDKAREYIRNMSEEEYEQMMKESERELEEAHQKLMRTFEQYKQNGPDLDADSPSERMRRRIEELLNKCLG